MTLTPYQENAKALAALLGIEEEDAARLLGIRIAVNYDSMDPASKELGGHVLAMLQRTIEYAGPPAAGDFDVEVVIGPLVPSTTACAKVYAGQVGSEFVVNGVRPLSSCHTQIRGPLRVIAACYIAAAAVRAALGPAFPVENSKAVVLSWSDLFGPGLERLSLPINIGETFLAGAGAVGHGFIYTLRYFDVTGTLYVTDPKNVTSGGLNRCLLFGPDDIGYQKASRLCQVAQPLFRGLELIPAETTLAEARKSRGTDFVIEHLVVGVDSRRARRSLQSELPHSVFDASTTGVSEVVLHFNRQPTELACLGCIYPENERERQHEENVAEAFGLTIGDVRSQFISATAASEICAKYPNLRLEDLVGRAFDTVYKELCGVGKLRQADGQQVLAPFSFVSVLAGAYLAVEFALRTSNNETTRFNYWRVSPWHSPVPALRQVRPRNSDCDLCSKPYFRRTMRQVWPGETKDSYSATA